LDTEFGRGCAISQIDDWRFDHQYKSSLVGKNPVGWLWVVEKDPNPLLGGAAYNASKFGLNGF